MITFVVAYAFRSSPQPVLSTHAEAHLSSLDSNSYGPVSWLVLSEIFPDDVRGRAVSMATIFNWGGNLVVSVSFLSLMGELGGDIVKRNQASD